MSRHRLAKLLLAAVSLAATAFVFMNTYEVVFNKDIVLANSVHPYGEQTEIKAIIDQFNIKPDQDQQISNASYQKLQYLRFPALSSNLYLEGKRVINGLWYARPNLAHYVELDKDVHGVTVDYLVYADANWRTLPDPNDIEQGMEVDLLHDGHKLAAYKVAEKRVLPQHAVFIPGKADKRQLVLILEDAGHGVYYGFSLVEKD